MGRDIAGRGFTQVDAGNDADKQGLAYPRSSAFIRG
jgi:hypothetical protein